MTTPIVSFTGEHRFLSNFYPCWVYLDGQLFQSVEAAYQAAKTLNVDERKRFTTLTAGQAKRAGRKLELRKDWDTAKLSVMLALVRQKFMYEDLKALLIATGTRELIEGNHWGDTFWGKCNGVGENHLGKILMQVRDESSHS